MEAELETVTRLIAAARTTERNALRARLRDPAVVALVEKAILGRTAPTAARAALAVVEEALSAE